MAATTRNTPAQSPLGTSGDRFGPPSVWFAFLGGPLAWAAHLLVSYGLVYVPCGVRLPLLLAATGALALVAIAAGLVSWSYLRRSREGAPGTPLAGRNRFVGIGGLLNSVLFLLIILAQGVTPLVLGGCG